MTQRNKSILSASIAACIQDNSTGEITALDVRGNLIDITDSLVFNNDPSSSVAIG